MKFVQEIKFAIEKQFAAVWRARTNAECIACIKNLRAGTDVHMGTAKLYARVECVRENNKIIGYVISAVHIAVSGAALFGGIMMIPIGMLAGAILFVYDINGITKEASHLRYREQSTSEGIFANSSMEFAEYRGLNLEQDWHFII